MNFLSIKALRELGEEFSLFPNYPIIGVGDRPFEALCYVLPHRFIIGVPHPKGRFSKFPMLFIKVED